MRLLLIKPNPSAHTTARLAASARRVMVEGEERVAVTASSGPRAGRSAADLKLAEASALLLAATHAATRAPNHDAIVLAISLDGAAVQLRQQHPNLPVIGMTEAALLTACLRSDRLGLLTLGSAMLPLYRQRVAVLCGYAEALQARCAMPVFDGVACAVKQARLQLACRASLP